MVYSPYIWPLLISSVLCVRIALYAKRYPEAPASRSFVVMMWLGVAWTLIYALSIVTVWYPLRVFLSMAMYVPTRLITPVILWLAVEYTGHERWLTRRNIGLVMAIPAAAILASLTSPWHTLFRYNFKLDTAGPLPILHYDGGIVYNISIAYGPLLVFFALGLFFFSLRDKALRPKTTMLLFLGILVPIIVEVLFALGITPIKGYNFAPSTILCTGSAYLLALMRYRLFSFAPIARSTVFENILDSVVVFDTQAQVVDCNAAALELLGMDAKSVLGASVDLLPKSWQRFFEAGAQEGEGRREVTLETRTGPRVYDASVKRIYDARRRYVGLLFLLHEITELRSSELRVTQLLAEKELLLREVHHRIKNNMSVIASILSLQMENLRDAAARSALADARSRVHSMMVLYERLYRSDGATDLTVDGYLGPLIDKIVATFGNASQVTVRKDMGNFKLGARLLFALGIIVNELITNAMKHAFGPQGRGTISISARASGETGTIRVEDDGGRFPEDVEAALAEGFGLQVVQLMSKQIDAELTVEREPNTRFTIVFPF